ncbi:formylglycine-generating enzyme family protein [Nodosilinea sp. E11]|uniref:formylglycine-generating enzyme family protein n=1 Tax=Nodosilinea sp. E11 TaxID=3037479 RepID=UPI002934D60B|nr:formylglycine-generating enzyme family protein [Nodosilinea sp. E11]WOD37024.1 formylglycine-generating enzyme family protein [Nodosilinea sp. E11]
MKSTPLVSRRGVVRSPLIPKLLPKLLGLLVLLSVLLPCVPVWASPSQACPAGMVLIHGGNFRIGSNGFYPEEHSAEDVTISEFCMGQYEVTNAEFTAFVNATGYVTVAERSLSQEQFPDLTENERSPGSVVFQIAQPSPQGEVPLLSWWQWVPGVNWQHPEGAGSTLEGRENHPVVHVAYEDAEAYAHWAGLSLPTEAQWEYAARGGLKDKIFAWGNRYSAQKANTWQGNFPFHNTQDDGYAGTAPVGSFPANGYGLFDMTGNVWEWTQDWYHVGHDFMNHATNPSMADSAQSSDPRDPGVAKHVIKGGSYLCAKNYCSRYRPAAREAQSPDTGTSHIGFRLVKNLPV